MAKKNAINLDTTNNADGFDIAGGTTKRKITVIGADITLTGSGSNTYTFPSATDTLVGRASTDTLTNKQITPRIGTIASGSIITPTGDSSDIYNVTALAANATIDPPSGTPTNGQRLLIRIKDNGTARTLNWNAIYRVIGVTLPTTTSINKTTYIGTIYNSADSKWDVLAVGQEV